MYLDVQKKKKITQCPKKLNLRAKVHNFQMASWTFLFLDDCFVHPDAELLSAVSKQASVYAGLPNLFHGKLQRKAVI